MSKLLIIGASVLQLPAIQRAKEMGHFVAVADFNPDAIGVKFADAYYNVSTIDIEAISILAGKIKPDGIMTLATDLPMRSVAAATSLLKLPGISFETAVRATDKEEMIRAFKAGNVASPWYFVVEGESGMKLISDKLIYPCIIKPTDNAGSRGVVLVQNQYEMSAAYTYSKMQSRSGKVIIEEYMTGNEVSVEVMAYENEVHILAITDKITTGAPHFVEMGHSQQSQLCPEHLNQIRDIACRAVEAIGIDQGPAHVEIMLTKNGPMMVELGARLGGDCISTHLVPLSTGIDLVKATIDVALGLKPDITPKFSKGSAIHYFSAPSGVIQSISGIDQAKAMEGVVEITFTKGAGEDVARIQSSTDRIGFLIAQGANSQDAIRKCENAAKEINIKTKN
jgi:biotin carboxylase